MAKGIKVGGAINKIVIITINLNPCACYLAQCLKETGPEVFLFNQNKLVGETSTWKSLTRLLEKRGFIVFVDNALFHLFRFCSMFHIRLWNKILKVIGVHNKIIDSKNSPPVLKPDPKIVNEPLITIVEVENINRSFDQDKLRKVEPDLIILAGAPILTKSTMAIAKVACLNPHCGIVPMYAGSNPVIWAAYENRFNDIGYTIHIVVPTVDGGPIIKQEKVEINAEKQLSSMWAVLAQKMYDSLAAITIDLVMGKTFMAISQQNVRVMPPAGYVVRLIAERKRKGYLKEIDLNQAAPEINDSINQE